MHPSRLRTCVAALALTGCLTAPPPAARGQLPPPRPQPPQAQGKHEDSYYYYGPNGLSKYWHDPNWTGAPEPPLGRGPWIALAIVLLATNVLVTAGGLRARRRARG